MLLFVFSIFAMQNITGTARISVCKSNPSGTSIKPGSGFYFSKEFVGQVHDKKS